MALITGYRGSFPRVKRPGPEVDYSTPPSAAVRINSAIQERGVYRVLVGKPEGRRPLGRPRRRWADNIRMDLQEVGCVYRDWIGLAQDRDRWRTLVSAVMNLRVP